VKRMRKGERRRKELCRRALSSTWELANVFGLFSELRCDSG